MVAAGVPTSAGYGDAGAVLFCGLAVGGGACGGEEGGQGGAGGVEGEGGERRGLGGRLGGGVGEVDEEDGEGGIVVQDGEIEGVADVEAGGVGDGDGVAGVLQPGGEGVYGEECVVMCRGAFYQGLLKGADAVVVGSFGVGEVYSSSFEVDGVDAAGLSETEHSVGVNLFYRLTR